jgi:hypothetical protein
LIASGVLAMQTAALSLAPAALASCNPGRTPHDGAARYAITAATVSSLTGVSSSILEYSPYYSGFNATGTNATVLLVQQSPVQRWAQLGWFKSKIRDGTVRRESGLEFFLSSSQNYFQWWSGRQTGTSTWYEILFEAPSTFNFFIAGTFVASYTGTFTPSEYQVFGETHDRVDQMPGGVNAPVTFIQTNYFTGSGHTTHIATAGISTVSYYGVSNRGGGTYWIWDKACTT